MRSLARAGSRRCAARRSTTSRSASPRSAAAGALRPAAPPLAPRGRGLEGPGRRGARLMSRRRPARRHRRVKPARGRDDAARMLELFGVLAGVGLLAALGLALPQLAPASVLGAG